MIYCLFGEQIQRSMSDNLKEQRDRFLAFSFASADLFIEVSEKGEVEYALGAAKGITGVDELALIGRDWLELFSKQDRPALVALRSKALPVRRCGPMLVTLDKEFGEDRRAVVTAIKMPDSEKFYLTLGFTSVLLARAGEFVRTSEEKDLLDKDTFLHAARESLDLARSLKQDLDLTLLDIIETDELKDRLGDKNWDAFIDGIGSLLRTKSIDGKTAAQIGDGRYSILHDKEIDSAYLSDQIAQLAKEIDPDGDAINVSSKTVTSELASLSERETTKALIYTINEFERKGTDLTIETLNSGFKAYVSANAERIVQLKSIIQQLNFDIVFQPIVDLNDGYKEAHFEMLSRFHDKGSTLEWIMFAEDVGMAPEFDMAVCDRALNYLQYKSSGRRSSFAINISGQSMQSDAFFDKLHAKLKADKENAKRLIFEITESTQIENLEKVNNFIGTLRAEGFKTCLDDFGAGSASFQYLQGLHVDYLKIDGQYTKKILVSDRDEAMVKNLISMCKDLNIKVVAEMVEEEEQAYRLKHLGADYAQGFLFARPSAKPEYDPPKSLSG